MTFKSDSSLPCSMCLCRASWRCKSGDDHRSGSWLPIDGNTHIIKVSRLPYSPSVCGLAAGLQVYSETPSVPEVYLRVPAASLHLVQSLVRSFSTGVDWSFLQPFVLHLTLLASCLKCLCPHLYSIAALVHILTCIRSHGLVQCFGTVFVL